MTDGEAPSSETPTVKKPSYPLRNRWTLWYLNDEKDIGWEERLKAVATIGTVEEFWALYNNIRPPSGLNHSCDYNFFKEGIQPMWEVPENKHGGRWLISIEKGKPAELMDTIWQEILIAMIGEQFGDDMSNICGLVCNVRHRGAKISMWTRSTTVEEVNLRIGSVPTESPASTHLMGHVKFRHVLRSKLMSAEMPRNFQGPPFDVLRYEDHDSARNKTSSSVKTRLSITAHDTPERT